MAAKDRRNPEPTSEVTTKVMKANKGKDTKPELIVRQMLREMGLPGYRLNWKKAPGRPDIAYPGRRIAIFVNGCFWHRCPYCKLSTPKTHSDFWQQKFDKNVERDRKKVQELEAMGWRTITIWECQLKKEPEKVRELLTIELERPKMGVIDVSEDDCR